jgi:tellurite resistance protein
MPMSYVEILRAACAVAGLDGQITAREAELLRKLADQAGVGSASLNAMQDRAKRDPKFYKEMFRVLRTDADATMKVLYCVAVADHELQPEESAVLNHFAKLLGLDDKRLAQLHAAAVKHVQAKGKDALASATSAGPSNDE